MHAHPLVPLLLASLLVLPLGAADTAVDTGVATAEARPLDPPQDDAVWRYLTRNADFLVRGGCQADIQQQALGWVAGAFHVEMEVVSRTGAPVDVYVICTWTTSTGTLDESILEMHAAGTTVATNQPAPVAGVFTYWDQCTEYWVSTSYASEHASWCERVWEA